MQHLSASTGVAGAHIPSETQATFCIGMHHVDGLCVISIK